MGYTLTQFIMPNEQVPPASAFSVSPQFSVPGPQTVPQMPAFVAGAIPTKYAGFWVRAAALFVDGLFLVVLQLLISLSNAGTESLLWKSAISLFIPWGYAVFMITTYQATLGKMAVGLRVLRANGERVGLGRALLREVVGKFISSIILGIGYLMVAWTGKKQGLHDKIADTVVVENDPSKSKTVWIVVALIVGLLIPIAIGILSSVVLASLNIARMKSVDARRIIDIKQLQLALELNYVEAGTYPISSFSDLVNNNYISSIPADPTTGAAYSYISLNDSNNVCAVTPCTKYVLAATLSDSGQSVLSSDVDGTVAGINCDDTPTAVYCVQQP